MKILAVDLGKRKSIACLYHTETSEHRYKTLPTIPRAIHDLVMEFEPDRVVIEIGSAAGWICDLVRSLGIEIQVANTAHEAWRWKNTKRKTDKDDALRLAQLSAMNQLPTVYVPAPAIRQWRSLIEYRARLVHRRTACKNQIRAILERQAILWPEHWAGFTEEALGQLEDLAEPVEATHPDALWRGMLRTELTCLCHLQELIEQIESGSIPSRPRTLGPSGYRRSRGSDRARQRPSWPFWMIRDGSRTANRWGRISGWRPVNTNRGKRTVRDGSAGRAIRPSAPC